MSTLNLHGCLDKKLLLADHLSRLEIFEQMEKRATADGSSSFFERTSVVDPVASKASTTPFGKLRHISVAHLELGRRNKGCRIEGAVCCVPFRGTAIEFVLAEDERKAVKVSAYNLLPVSAPTAQVRRLLPVGTRLAVKEPYYKSFRDGTSGIRVDNPADIVFLVDSERDDVSSNFDVMKERGNTAFRLANYELAQTLYEKCCQQQPQNIHILSNLAAVHICLENWVAALKHAQSGLDVNPEHVKCLYRHGIAATSLGQYTRASCDLILAQKLDPSNHDIASCLRSTQELQRQSQGQFDPDKLFLNGQHKSPLTLANFTGPLKVTHLPGKGRGMVVTEDVAAGTLLAVCNPLAIAYTDPSDSGFQVDYVNMTRNDRSQADLITKLANVSMHNPDVLQQMYALYDGTQASLDNTPDIRMFTTQLPGNKTAQAVTDVCQIADIVKHNAFGPDKTSAGASAQVTADMLIQDKTQDKKWSGLYPLMSLINHSCCPNSLYYFVKDAAMLRAGCSLKEGDEVTISYMADLDGTASRRQRDLRSGWNFTCSCSRCELEQELPADVQNKLDAVHDELYVDFVQPGSIVAEFRQAVSMQRQAGFLPIARKLDKLLVRLEGKLAKASLSQHQQHWVMFTVMQAYLCRRQCSEAMADEHRLPQIGKQIAAMYESTVPGSSPHIHEMIRTVERAQHLCPGTTWQRQASKAAQSVLQLRYGLLTKAQTKNALQTALHNNSSIKYAKNVVYDD